MTAKKKIAYFLCIIFIMLLYLSLVKKQWTPEWDSAYFISIGRSLATGNGFEYLGLPVSKVPIGFPLLLSSIISIWGVNFLALNILILGCALGAIWATYFLFRQYFKADYSMLITFLSGISYLMVERSIYIMSDVPYYFLSFLALIFLHRFASSAISYKDGLIAGILITLSVFIRTVGFGIFLGFLFFICVSKHVRFKLRKVAIISILVIVPQVTWNLVSARHTEKPNEQIQQLAEFIPYQQEYLRIEYDEPMSGQLTVASMIVRIIKNTIYYSSNVSSLVLGRVLPSDMATLLSVKKNPRILTIFLLMGTIVLVVLIGFLNGLGSEKRIIDIYVIFYLGTHLLISAREPRYLIGVMPFIFLYFIDGITRVSKKIPIQPKKEIAAAIALVFLAFVTFSNVKQDIGLAYKIHKTQSYIPGYDKEENIQNFMKSILWIKNNIPDNSKIIGVNAPWIVLLAERFCISFPWVDDHKTILKFIKHVSPEYLVVAPIIGNKHLYLLPILINFPDLFYELSSYGEAKVYLIDLEKLSKII